MFVIFDSMTKKQTSFLLIYRKNTSIIQRYLEGLRHFLGHFIIDIVLGDFNIKIFDENKSLPLRDYMTEVLLLFSSCTKCFIYVNWKSVGSCLCKTNNTRYNRTQY